MNKFILGILLLPFVFSCEGKREATPTYLHIEEIGFNYDNISTLGNGGTAITDAWVYNNDNLLGVFELPATIAITAEGAQSVTIRGGIKLNGISATREFYAYYQPWNSDIELSPLDTTTIEPVVRYWTNTGISFYESFEDAVLKIDTSTVSDVGIDRTKVENEPDYIDRYVGKVVMTSSEPGFKAYNKSLFQVPTESGTPIYLEIDYKCNQEFTVGALVQEPGLGITESRIITLRSTADEEGVLQWKHVYVDLTDYFLGKETASGFGFSFTAYYTSENPEGLIYLDNVKVVNAQ